MFAYIFFIFLTINELDAWSGILLDGAWDGTQVYVPGNQPVNTPNVNFGLPHLMGQAAVMLNGKAYFISGYSTIPPKNIVTIFNPTTNSSTYASSLNISRNGHGATVVAGMILVCGGFNGDVGYLASCEQYNSQTNKWNLISSLPTAPNGTFVMTTLNNRAYIFGGLVKNGPCDASLPPVIMFDGQNWVPRSSFAGLPFASHAGVAIDIDRALICGGSAFNGGSCSADSNCFIYSASSDSWIKAASMAQARCLHSMVMFEGKDEYKMKINADGFDIKITDQIYIFGDNCGGDWAAVELYSPTTGGTILSTKIVGGNQIATVSIG